jgi:hypothetical protein
MGETEGTTTEATLMDTEAAPLLFGRVRLWQ